MFVECLSFFVLFLGRSILRIVGLYPMLYCVRMSPKLRNWLQSQVRASLCSHEPSIRPRAERLHLVPSWCRLCLGRGFPELYCARVSVSQDALLCASMYHPSGAAPRGYILFNCDFRLYLAEVSTHNIRGVQNFAPKMICPENDFHSPLRPHAAIPQAPRRKTASRILCWYDENISLFNERGMHTKTRAGFSIAKQPLPFH